MLDLILNESLVRACINAGAIVTPVLGIIAFLARKRKRAPRAAPESASSASSASAPSAATHSGSASSSAQTPPREDSFPPAARRQAASLSPALALGLSGPAIWLLWRIYEAIMDAFGFASVRGLLLCLFLFIALGAAVGWFWGRASARRDEPPVR